jgi:hypothetical protein
MNIHTYVHTYMSKNTSILTIKNPSKHKNTRLGWTNLVKVVAHNLPDMRPFETNTSHVVVCNLNNFRKAKHSRRTHVKLLRKTMRANLN